MTEIKQITRPYLDVFDPVVEDKSVDWLQYRDFVDVNANFTDSNSDFRIQVDDKQTYFLPHKSYLEIQFKLLNDTDNFTVDDNIALQNNAAGIMNRYEFRMDENVVDYIDNAETTNTVQNLVYFSKEHSSSIASQQLWYPDTADSGLNVPAAFTSLNDLETVNYGHRKRWQLTNGSRNFAVHIPLKNIFGFLKSFQEVVKGIKLTLRMSRNNEKYLFLGGAFANTKLKIQSLKWWLPYIKPNATVLPSLEMKFNEQRTHDIPFVDVQTYRTNVMPGLAVDRVYQLRTKRSRPVKVFVFFQSQARYEGPNTVCKRVFDHMGVTKMRIVLNSTTKYPEREYATVFSDGTAGTSDDYARVYSEFLRCGLKDHDIDQSGVVDIESFKRLYPIFCFDLTERFENETEPEQSLIEIFYSNSQNVNHYMWVMVESEVKLELSTNGGQMKFMKLMY